MSDSGDDWENQLDSENEEETKKKEEEEKAKKKAAFDDEDKVDADVLAAKKKEELKKQAEEEKKNKRIKNKPTKVDYDKIFEERQKKLAGNLDKKVPTAKELEGMTEAQKAQALAEAADSNLADQLIGEETGASVDTNVTLNSEKDYKDFGKNVAKALYAGKAPYRIENFFKELCKDLSTVQDSKQIKKVADNLMTIYNAQVKAEKEKAKSKKKAPAVKGGGGKGYEFNNNQAMISDVMGDAQDYGDYGDEGFRREEEADYDFM